MADPATVFDTVRIVVRPMHQAAKFIPLIHAAKPDAVTHAQRYPTGEIDVVGNQERLPSGQLQNESLVPGAIVVVR